MLSSWYGRGFERVRMGKPRVDELRGDEPVRQKALWKRVPAARSPDRRARAFVFLVCACLIGVTASRIYLARELQLRESRITTTNLARSLAEHARAILEAADIVISGLAERVEADGADGVALQRLQRHMIERISTVSRIRGLTVRAADGQLLASTWVAGQEDSGASDGLHLEHHLAHFDPGPFVGPPVRDKASGDWTISVSRRFDGHGGGLGGVAVAILDCSTFQTFYDSFKKGDHGVLALTHADGTMLVRVPPIPWIIGRNVGDTPLFAAYRQHGPVGDSQGVSTVDGEMRWNSFRKVDGFPLMVFVALSEADILADWRRDAWVASTISVFIASVLGVVGWRMAEQIRARADAETAIRRSEGLYRLLAENSTDLIIQLGPDERRRYVSPASELLLGYAPEELLGQHPSTIVHPEDWAAVSAHLGEARSSGSAAPVNCRARRKDGSEIWLEVTARRVEGGEGAVVALRDISRRKAAELQLHEANNQLQRLVMLDGLTGIANRRCFDAVLANEFRRGARVELPLSLLLIDVDHFKIYNDLYGHLEGDSCLRIVAEAVSEGVQRPADLAARFGGEEFAVLLAETDLPGALTIAERVRVAVRAREVSHEGAAARIVTVSIGVAVGWPNHQGHGAERLVRMADVALYRAKLEGRDRVCLGSPEPTPVAFPGA